MKRIGMKSLAALACCAALAASMALVGCGSSSASSAASSAASSDASASAQSASSASSAASAAAVPAGTTVCIPTKVVLMPGSGYATTTTYDIEDGVVVSSSVDVEGSSDSSYSLDYTYGDNGLYTAQNGSTMNSTYSYTMNDKGQVAQVTIEDTLGDSSTIEGTKTYTYNAEGQIVSIVSGDEEDAEEGVVETIEYENNLPVKNAISTTFDGKNTTTTYTVNYEKSDNGYIATVSSVVTQDGNEVDNQTYVVALTVDEHGCITQAVNDNDIVVFQAEYELVTNPTLGDVLYYTPANDIWISLSTPDAA